MTEQKNIHFVTAGKSLLWVLLMTLFASAPYLFLQIINMLSEENVAAKEITHLLKGGIIVFIGCAVAGAAFTNFIFAKFRVTGWLPFFAIYISPVCMLLYVFLKYLLLYVQFGDDHNFGPGVLGSKLIIIFAFIYSFAVRSIHQQKLDHARHDLNTRHNP